MVCRRASKAAGFYSTHVRACSIELSMWLPFHSLRFRLVAFPLALLALWLILALMGAIYGAKERIIAEVKASSALARALIDAASANGRDSAATLLEVEKHLPPTRHVLLGITGLPDPAAIRNMAGRQQLGSTAPSWFVNLIAPARPVELVKVASASDKAEWIYIIPNPADEIEEVWQDFSFIAAICTALVAIIVGSSLWMARNALRPIRALGEGLERLEKEDFHVNLEPVRFTELQRIAGQFDSLARSLRDKTFENQHLYEKLILTQESERRQVARELHDELGPCLFGIRAEAASILQNLQRSHTPEGPIAERAKAIDALVDTVQQINRRILHTIQPAVLTERGLAAALRDLVDGWQGAYPETAWSLDCAETGLDELSQEVTLAIYRVVQEGLTNVARHSECSEAGIVVSRRRGVSGDILDILVRDDGKGFDLPPRPGGGLQGMEERIRKLGGDFGVQGGSGGLGVTVKASIPLASMATS
jgi:two-component system sensor histidine kinase UhpB